MSEQVLKLFDELREEFPKSDSLKRRVAGGFGLGGSSKSSTCDEIVENMLFPLDVVSKFEIAHGYFHQLVREPFCYCQSRTLRNCEASLVFHHGAALQRKVGRISPEPTPKRPATAFSCGWPPLVLLRGWLVVHVT